MTAGARPEVERVAALAALLREHDRAPQLLVVTDPTNLRYITGFTGTNGLALIAAHTGGELGGDPALPSLFLTDFRYETQSAAQVPELYERLIFKIDLAEALANELSPGGAVDGGQEKEKGEGEGKEVEPPRKEVEPPRTNLAELFPGGGRVGFEEGAMSFKRHARLRELLGERWELVPCGGLVEELREVKSPAELAAIRAACQLADAALREVLENGLVGRSERELAIDLELRMRRLGATGPSFPTIVAAGPHGALPHAEPRDQPIPRDTLVTIDWGALLDGYCSDCTRTYATGEHLPDGARDVYELVLRAQLAGLAAVRAGLNGKEIDAVAREAIEQAGHGERFGHGLGHGVGMEVHEAPRLSRTAGEQPLRAGTVVTVEPGVYLPERFGVRIEDLVAVDEEGSQVLTMLSKQLTVVA
ncbi:MAG TPA: aminopeptidase P family protein [Solirubrobacteraceae bacterium]|nr:aminopeptidase P family protein [Solirubrobacteraceae bacterium]